jgi:hypothetical protein
MKGDFSRLRFDRARNYTSVLAQQGRVQLDADANEQRAIDEYLRATGLTDIIGHTGTPRNNPGFAITTEGTNIGIGTGRYYVDGLLCEAAQQTDYMQQRWLTGAQPSATVLLSDLGAGRSGSVQVWLEVWQRLVTPIDDPGIKDVALGEADTTDRLQTVWRVVAEPGPAVSVNTGDVVVTVNRLRQSLSDLRLATQLEAITPVEAQAATLSAQVSGGRLNAAELRRQLSGLQTSASAILARATAAQTAVLGRAPTQPQAQAQIAAANAAVSAIGQLPVILQLTCCDMMHQLPAPTTPGRMTAGTQDAGGQGSCLPAPHAAYRGLENQLYRVEVHRGGPIAQATFKWSRDNGSVVTRITQVSGPVVTVDSLGPDANLGFAPLDWVEITDDRSEFGQPPNQPGTLHQIKIVDSEHLQITLTDTAPAVDTTSGHAKLRRWDQVGDVSIANGVPINPSGPNVLENGITVQFSADQPFNSGDYWLVPARTATGQPEWPPSDSDGATYQPARSVHVHRAPLACIHFDRLHQQFQVDDCRDFFSPLTELAPPTPPQALHITAIGWSNDDLLSLDQLFSQGLVLSFDTSPTSTIDGASFIVELELPLQTQGSDATVSRVAAGVGVLRWPFVVDAGVTVNTTGNTVTWLPGSQLLGSLSQLINELAGGQFVRARVTLKGRTIFTMGPSGPVYLDGQCFGAAGTRGDGSPRMDLSVPSGNGEKASDFESWFYLTPTQQIASVNIDHPNVAFVVVSTNPFGFNQVKLVDMPANNQPDPGQPAVTPAVTVTLRVAATAATTIALSVSGGIPGTVQLQQQSVTVPRGATTPTAPVALAISNPGAGQGQTYTVTATLTLPSGQQTSATATITVTGVDPGGIIFRPTPGGFPTIPIGGVGGPVEGRG